MHAEMWQIEEERLTLVTPDEVLRLRGKKVGEVLAFRVLDLGIRCEIEVRALADNGLIEAAFARVVIAFVPDVPFAEHSRRVAGGFQCGREDDTIEGKIRDVIN